MGTNDRQGRELPVGTPAEDSLFAFWDPAPSTSDAEQVSLAALRSAISYTVKAGTSAASIVTALQAGGYVVFEPGTYDLSGLTAGVVLANAVHLRALPGAQVIVDMPGANQAQFPALFALRCPSFSCVGPFRFQNGVTPFDLDTLDQTIEVHIEGCEFSEVGAIIGSNNVGSFNASAVLKTLRIKHNRVRSCNSGVNLRLGDGAASAAYDIPLHYAEIVGNDLETIDKYGLVCNYDSEAVPYPVDGLAIVSRNRIVDLRGRGSTVTGFGINVTAARRVNISDNYLRDIQLGTRGDLEPIYVKSPSGIIARNVIVDGGQNQAAIACKSSAGSGVEFEGLEVSGNKIISTGAGVVLNGIWVQRSRVHVHGNYIFGAFSNSAIRADGDASPFADITIENNEIALKNIGGRHGIRLNAGAARARVMNNRLTALESASGTAHLLMVFGNDATDAYPELLVRGNRFRAEAAVVGTCHGVTIQLSGGAAASDPRIEDNRFDGADSAVNVMSGGVTGKVWLARNDASGVAAAVVDTAGSTQFDSRGDVGLTGLPAARTVYGLAAGTNVTLAVDPATGRTTVNSTGGSGAGLPSIEDYGAVGDGTTDDSAAIQAAIDAAAVNGGAILVGARVYGVGTTLTMRPGVTLYSNVPHGWYEGYTFAGDSFDGEINQPSTRAGRFQALAGLTGNLITVDRTSVAAGIAGRNRHRGMVLRGLILDGHQIATRVLRCEDSFTSETWLVIEDCHITGAIEDGIWLGNSIAHRIERCRITACGGATSGWAVNCPYGVADTHFVDCWIQVSRGGIRFGEGTTHCYIRGGKIEDNYSNGGLVLSPSYAGTPLSCRVVVMGVSFQTNGQPGIIATGATADADSGAACLATVVGCYFNGNGKDQTGTDQSQVRADKQAKITLTGCSFNQSSALPANNLVARGASLIISTSSAFYNAVPYTEETGGTIVGRVGDFTGAGGTPVMQTPVGIDFGAALAIEDEGTPVLATAARVNFVGAGVTVADAGANEATITIPGAGSVTGLITVANIAALQAITPTAGAAVWVEGYTTPGDGGGGLFRADMTGALQTDGGIVFNATADQSAVQTETGKTRTSFTDAPGITLAQSNLVFGSVQVDPESASLPLVFADSEMHGHRLNSGGHGLYPLVNHKLGSFPPDPQKRFDNYLATGGATTTATVRYRYLTNARRWARQHDGRTLDVRWFGVTADGTDQRDKIAWALNAAKRLGFKEVRLNGSYSYLGGIELPAGISFGWGKLTCRGNDEVLAYLHRDYVANSTTREPLAGLETCICPEDNSADWRLYDLELDGNYSGNLTPLVNNARYSRLLGVQSTLQNTPAWNAFSTSNHSGRIIPLPQKGVMRNVHMHGYGGNCYLGHGHTWVDGVNVKFGDSVRNHVFYGLHGVMVDLTVHGFGWAALGKSEHCQFIGLNFRDIRTFDFAPDSQRDAQDAAVPLVPWNAAAQLLTFEGMRRGPGTLLTGTEADRWRQIGITIDGGQWDLGGLTEDHMAGPLIYGGGQHLSVQNVTVMGPFVDGPTNDVTFASEITLGGDSEFYEGWSFKNITILQRGKTIYWHNKDVHAGVLTIENCSIQDMRGYEGVAGASSPLGIVVVEATRTGPNALVPRIIRMTGVRQIRALQALWKVNVTNVAGQQVRIIVEGCSFNMLGNVVLRNEAGTGTLAGMTIQNTELVRMSMRDSFINFPASSAWADAELFLLLTSFSNVRTFAGLKSEAGGEIAATAGQVSADISTGLMWAPRIVEVEIIRAAGAVTGLTGQMRDSGNAGALSAASNRTNPRLALSWTGALALGDVIRWKAKLGGPEDGAFLLNVVPLAVGATGTGGGVTDTASVETAITSSVTLSDASHAWQSVNGSTLQERRLMVAGSGTQIDLTVNASLTRPVKVVIDSTHSSAAAVRIVASGVTWDDGTSAALVVRSVAGSRVMIEPIGDGRVAVIGDVVRLINIGSNAISNYRQRKYGTSGPTTLSTANFMEGSTLVHTEGAADYTVVRRLLDTDTDRTEALVIRNRGSGAITLTKAGALDVTLMGDVTIPINGSATLEYEVFNGIEYVWIDGGTA